MYFFDNKYNFTFLHRHFIYIVLCLLFNIKYNYVFSKEKQYIESQRVEIHTVKNNLKFKNSILENENFIDKLLFFLKNNTYYFLDKIYQGDSYDSNLYKILLENKKNYLEIKNNKNISEDYKKIKNLEIYNKCKKNIELLKKKIFKI